jgi:ElaB/YqjD/DUF883 family membrane-anchored ribosome-binding protein
MQDPMNQPPCEADRQDAQPSTSAKDQSEGRLNQVKEQITSFGRSAVDRVEAQREPAAQALGNTASNLHERGDQIARATGDAAQAAADKIKRVADYVRYHDTKAMIEDAGDLVRRYPGQFLAAGAILGFLVGRSLRGRDYRA